MVKTVAIFLSMILLTQGLLVNYSELKKMDALVEHAKFHQEQYGDDMSVFFDKHYGDQKDEHFKENQEERSDHEQLPYQISALFVNQAVCYFDQPTANLTADFNFESEKVNFFYNQLYTSLLISEIPHPPRISA